MEGLRGAKMGEGGLIFYAKVFMCFFTRQITKPAGSSSIFYNDLQSSEIDAVLPVKTKRGCWQLEVSEYLCASSFVVRKKWPVFIS